MKKIVFTGPESSGKTTLAQKSAKRFGLKLVPEYSRTFLEQNGPEYTYQDLVTIANGQIEIEDQVNNTGRFEILDTDILTIKIWSMYKFDRCERFIEDRLALLKNRFYFLCKPDIEWVFDPLRESPNEREILFEYYKSEIEKLGAEYTIISGSFTEREEAVFVMFENFFGE